MKWKVLSLVGARVNGAISILLRGEEKVAQETFISPFLLQQKKNKLERVKKANGKTLGCKRLLFLCEEGGV